MAHLSPAEVRRAVRDGRHAGLTSGMAPGYLQGNLAVVHRGDPAPLGIRDLMAPDFGESISLEDGDIPLYWGCGLTALAALERARLPRFITHAPGAMLVTDLKI
jgi:uncharacterized protein YcsI (UPF0317 family)